MASARMTRPRLSAQEWKCMSRPSASPKLPYVQSRGLSIQQLDEQRRGRERVVILGSGWAGYSLSRGINARKYQVVVVSPRTYFVFTPLLASTAVGTLEFRTALEPVRSFRGRGVGAEFFQGWADNVDLSTKTLSIEAAVGDPLQSAALTASDSNGKTSTAVPHAHKGELFELSWDKLVVAVGCYAQTFNTKGVRENAFFLKDVGDARRIRTRLLTCFETAALPTTSDETRKHLLNFAIVGGGPTGVEFAAELHDTVYEDLQRVYPELIEFFKITIYDVAPKVLGMFDEKLAKYATDTFRREKIEIRTSHHVEELRLGAPGDAAATAQQHNSIQPYTLHIKEEGDVGVGMCVWSTGLMMNPFIAKALDGKVKRHDRSGSVMTDDQMQVQAADGSAIKDVFALGDCAMIEGAALPATAQVANQKATWLAKRFNKGDISQQHFTYKNLGVMAYVGNRKAIFQGGAGADISGRIAWLIWRGVYLTKAVSARNRILIPIYWSINWLFGRDISRF